MIQNIPEVKLGIVAVSRDCFPIALSEKRRAAIVAAYGQDKIYECPVTVEKEADMLKAVEDVRKAECNAQRPRRCLLRHAELLLQPGHAPH